MIIICGHLADLGLGERCLNYRQKSYFPIMGSRTHATQGKKIGENWKLATNNEIKLTWRTLLAKL